MSEFSLSSTTTKKKTNISSLLLTDFSICFYFLLSHPLYFISFIFLSPYVYKLLSFLSPLFITTSILILALIVHNSKFNLPESEVSLVLYIYKGIIDKFRSNLSITLDGCVKLDDLEIYKIVFESSSSLQLGDIPKEEDRVVDIDQSSIVKGDEEVHEIAEVKTLRGLLHEKEEGLEVKTLSAKIDKVVEERKVEARGSKEKWGPKEVKIINNVDQLDSSDYIESYHLNRQSSKHFNNDERKVETVSMSNGSKVKEGLKEAKMINNDGQPDIFDHTESCNLSLQSSKHFNKDEGKVEIISISAGSKAKWGHKEAKMLNNGGQSDLFDRIELCNLSRQSSKHFDNVEGKVERLSMIFGGSKAKWCRKEAKTINNGGQSNLSDYIESCNLNRSSSKHSNNDQEKVETISMSSGFKVKWGHKEAKVINNGGQSDLPNHTEPYNLNRQSSKHSDNDEGFSTPKSVENLPSFGSSHLGSFGSMRKEKEWRKTLACKLFEERHSGNESEDMDMLWETHENESMKQQSKSKKGSNGRRRRYEEDEGAEESDDGEGDRQLCCLQALKFSATKMNLGMRRPNLVKISKAITGIGWLHHVGKHGKKSYH